MVENIKMKSDMRAFKHIIVVVLIIVFFGEMLSCGNERKGNTPQEQAPQVSTPSPVYEQPLYYAPVTPSESQPARRVQEPQREEPPTTATKTIEPTITISKYYEEGYDAGYDDGEDDAVSGNGWGGQFDDSCRYKVKPGRTINLDMKKAMKPGIMTIKTETNNIIGESLIEYSVVYAK